MSKIYEALVRAEQERAAIDESRPGRSATATADAETEHSVAPRATPTEFEFAAHAAMGESVQPAVALPSFHPEEVKVVEWKPSLLHLPALQERGRALEQFRSLRSRLFEFRDLNTLKSILVSSGLPQEGKSYVAANLALSFARHKSARVLLIDGDMRRSSLHHLFGCEKEPGLTTYLSGKASLEAVMQRPRLDELEATQLRGLGSLTFIGGGIEGENAADLSGNPRFAELIATASPHFDWIVVDSSPVNLVSDGVNLARACDGVLLVTRSGVTKLETAQRALNELKASKVLGVVLNAVDRLPVGGDYYGYDSYDSYDPIVE